MQPRTGARVVVDAAAHDVRVDVRRPDGRRGQARLGALRTSLVRLMELCADALGLHVADEDLTPIASLATDALQRAAGPVRDAALEAEIAAICATPLLYAAPFLEARWVWADALRFRACRVAIACAEDLVIDGDSPETAVSVVDKLGAWRALFAREGTSKRAINAVLTRFGDTLPAPALWGLRNVRLTRPHDRLTHVELLGWLGALHQAPDEVRALVEAAPAAEVDALLDDRLPELRASLHIEGVRGLASFLAGGDPGARTLAQLERSCRAARARDDANDGRGGFPRPPIAPPTEESITLLGDAAALRREGERMHHCVASLTRACSEGSAYVFHVERAGAHGTVHLDAGGRVVQAQGPCNRPSSAAAWGARVLEDWGAGLWFTSLALERLVWPVDIDAPPGARPLRSLRAFVDAYLALAAQRPSARAALAEWFRARAHLATRGGTWLALRGDGTLVVGEPSGVREIDVDAIVAARAQAQSRQGLLRDAGVRVALPAAMAEEPMPIARPQYPGIEPIARSQARALLDGLPRRAGLPEGAAHWCFRCHDDVGWCVVVVHADERAEVAGATCAADAAERWRARLQAWARGFWGPRLGLARSTWSGGMIPPTIAEPLTTVGACHALYMLTCVTRSDVDGRLARFYEQHVRAAVAGDAWLVVRDRAQGLVSVLDARRNVVARTDALLGEPDRAQGPAADPGSTRRRGPAKPRAGS